MSSHNRWQKCHRRRGQTQDRIGDYLASQWRQFLTTYKHKLCMGAELSVYEQEARPLVRLASTGRVVTILERYGRMLESYLQVLQIPISKEVKQWSSELVKERQERLKLFQNLLLDDEALIEAMGGECQQMEILTLLKQDFERYEEELTEDEQQVMAEVYNRVVMHSEVVLVGSAPSWFLSPMELLESGPCFYLDDVRVSKCLTGEGLANQVNQEERCLRQASTWTDLHHPHVAKMLGGCYVGRQPFLVHEPAEPLVRNRANAHSWQPLLGWALGLQYLHERELRYKSFEDERLLVRHFATSSGVLSGLNLESVRGRVCVPEDIYALGMAIYMARRRASLYSDSTVLELPDERPSFLAEPEWSLLQKMCAKSPRKRVDICHVIHHLQSFVSTELASKKQLDSKPMELTGTKPIDEFFVRHREETVATAIPHLEVIHQALLEENAMLRHVFDRIIDVRSQLQTTTSTIDVSREFVDLLDRFCLLLQTREKGKKDSSNRVTRFCGSRARAQEMRVFHNDIDRLQTLMGTGVTSPFSRCAYLQAIGIVVAGLVVGARLQLQLISALLCITLVVISSSFMTILPSLCGNVFSCPSTSTHNWKRLWDRMRRQQLQEFQSYLAKPTELEKLLGDPPAREEAQMLLQFELEKRGTSYPESVRKAMSRALQVLPNGDQPAEPIPRWFIPPYEVQLGEVIGNGSFADVYDGKWFDTDVVIKILEESPSNRKAASPKSTRRHSQPQPNEDVSVVFRREADHWFMLSHQNVVHLYGACHVGRQFFVCEPAKKQSLDSHVKALSSRYANCSPARGSVNAHDVMKYLLRAGRGLKHLHDRGIKHCDLKLDNLLVSADGKEAKLADFGLSVAGKGNTSAYDAPGAYRWKAPECLLGAWPTFESDVFGFGMCILQLLSGQFPWGHELPDLAVKFHVTKRKQLPPKPKCITPFQWSLIKQMCCFNPRERISLAAAVEIMRAFSYEEPRMAKLRQLKTDNSTCGGPVTRMPSLPRQNSLKPKQEAIVAA